MPIRKLGGIQCISEAFTGFERGVIGKYLMSQETLKWLRLITPAIIILFFFAIIGAVTSLWKPVWPQTPNQWKASLTYLIPAIIYYISPFREWSNKPYFNDVTDNIRTKLLKISDIEDKQNNYSWRSIRGIYYYLIDNDKSLTKKAHLAYSNGWIWTTIADIRIISTTLAIFFALASLVFNIDGSSILFVLFGLVGLATIPASNKVTELHKSISDEQIEIIEHYYLEDLKRKLKEIEHRNDS